MRTMFLWAKNLLPCNGPQTATSNALCPRHDPAPKRSSSVSAAVAYVARLSACPQEGNPDPQSPRRHRFTSCADVVSRLRQGEDGVLLKGAVQAEEQSPNEGERYGGKDDLGKSFSPPGFLYP